MHAYASHLADAERAGRQPAEQAPPPNETRAGAVTSRTNQYTIVGAIYSSQCNLLAPVRSPKHIFYR